MITLRIMSVAGVFLYMVLFLVIWSEEGHYQYAVIGTIAVAFSYAVAHAIVSIWQGQKHNIKSMVVMSVIGFATYQFQSFVIASGDTRAAATMSFIYAICYALIFAIVTFFLSYKKPAQPR